MIPESTVFHQKFVNDMYKRITEQNAFARMIGPRKPLSRWQRFRYRMSEYGDRLKNAWRALRGEWPDYD